MSTAARRDGDATLSAATSRVSVTTRRGAPGSGDDGSSRRRFEPRVSDVKGLGLLGSGEWILGMGCLRLDLSGLERGYDQISGFLDSH